MANSTINPAATPGNPNSFSLTPEQDNIVKSNGNARINAVAGSGKTSTLLAYAASRPAGSRILYMAFNKSVKLEAIEKFRKYGLSNVTVETAHSLAYKHIVPASGYMVRSAGYKTHELVDLLQLRPGGDKHTAFIIANHINKFVTYFCNSDRQRVQDLNYLHTITDPRTAAFVRSFYPAIEEGTRILLSRMDKGEIEITHDFYLKKFQLSSPSLPFDHILFDEGQDASAAMLDVFLRQHAVKLIVGDTHQQIYSWRYAVNSLDKTDFARFQLSTSFRFRQDIASLASSILDWKNLLAPSSPVAINGKGAGSNHTIRATLARTNLGLLLEAINYITSKWQPGLIHFEGNLHSYTYADDGTSLYDVLSLYNGRRSGIRDKLLQSMKDYRELEDYVEKTGDVQLGMMAAIIEEYGNEIPHLIKTLKEKHVSDGERSKASMIFSTVHRAKGLEYDEVTLANDFITREKLEKLLAGADDKENPVSKEKLNEEINLLYVAVTRTKNIIHIPEKILPADLKPSPYIKIIRTPVPFESTLPASREFQSFNKNRTPAYTKFSQELMKKKYSVEKKRVSHKDAYKPWTADLDRELRIMLECNRSIVEIAALLGRTEGAIRSRLKRLNGENF